MFFVVVGRFRKGAEQACAELTSEFSDHLASNRPRIRVGGPLRDEGGAKAGVFYITEAPSREVVADFAHSSPYALANLYESMNIDEMTLEIGNMG